MTFLQPDLIPLKQEDGREDVSSQLSRHQQAASLGGPSRGARLPLARAS